MAQKKLYRALSLAVMIAVLTVILALSAVAEIEGGNGVITGLDNGSYKAAPVTLNSTGDGYTVGDYTAVDSTTTGLAGLYDVRPSDDETEGLVNLVYVYGSFTDRAQLGTFDDETGNAVYNGSATFMPGTWTNANSGYPLDANNSYYVRAHQWLGSTAKSAQLFALEKTYSEALEYFVGNPNIVEDGALRKDLVDNYYSIYYVTDEGGNITNEFSEEGAALKESLTAEYKNAIEGFNFKYAFDASEIIPVSEVGSIQFAVCNDAGSDNYTITSRKVVFYVMNAEGTVIPYTWEDNTSTSSFRYWYTLSPKKFTADPTAIDDFPTENAWVVGIEIYPFATVDMTTHSWSLNGTNDKTTLKAMQAAPVHRLNIYLDAYVIPVPELPAPTGLWVDGNEIKGLDENSSYTFAPYTLAGLVTDETVTIDRGNTSCAGLTAGIWSVVATSDYGVTKPAYVYVEGLYSDRDDLFVADETKAMPTTYVGSTTGFVAGSVTFPTTAADKNAAYNVQLTTVNGSYNLLAGSDPADDDEKALHEAEFETKAAELREFKISYAFTPDEIVSVSDLNTFAWYFNGHYNCFMYNNLVSKFVAYIAAPDGTVTPYEYNHAAHNFGSATDNWSKGWNYLAKQTVNFTEQTSANGTWETALPTEGYLVAFEAYPFAGMNNYNDVVYGGTARDQKKVDIAFVFDKTNYVIAKPAYSAPEGLYVEDRVVKGLDADASYIAYPFTVNKLNTENAQELGSGNTSIAGLTAGLWAITRAGDENFNESTDYALVYIEGTVSGKQNLFTLGENGLISGASGTEFVVGSIVSTEGWEASFPETQNKIANFGELLPSFKSSSTASDDEKRAEFNSRVERFTTTKFLYAYTSDEVIPISEVESYTWGLSMRYTSIGYKDLQPKFVAHIMDNNGNITEYEYIHVAADLNRGNSAIEDKDIFQYSNQVKKVDFTAQTSDYGRWTTPLPTEGYLVGFEIYPLANMNNYDNVLTTGLFGNTTAWLPNFSLLVCNSPDNYVIKPNPAPTPTGLYVEGNEVKGLDKDYSYTLTPYTYAGLLTENAIPLEAGNTSCANLTAGIWAVSANTEYLGNSAPAYVYVQGAYADRQALGTYGDDLTKPNAVAGKYEEWKAGYFTNPVYLHGASVSNSLISVNNEFLPTAIQKELIELLNAGTATEEEISAQKTEIANYLKTISLRYAYAPEEIIPVSELKSFKFNIAVSQLRVGYDNAKAAVTFKVLGEDGEITDKTWVSPNTYNSTYEVAGGVTFTADLTDLLKDVDGWVVAFEVIPVYELDRAGVKHQTTAENYYSNNTYIKVDTSSTGYVISKPVAEAPTGLALVDNKVTGLVNGVDYVYAPFTVNGVDYESAESLTSEIELTTGLWAVCFDETDDYAVSKPVLFYVAGTYSEKQQIGTFTEDSTVPAYAVSKTDLFQSGTFVGYGNFHSVEKIDNYFKFYEISAGIGGTIQQNADTTEDATLKAQYMNDLLTQMKTVHFTYQYADDEILPANELKQIKFKFTTVQGKLWNYRPSVTFYVADAEGIINEYVWSAETYSYNPTLTLDTTTVLPQTADEYVLGFKILPWGAATLDDIIFRSDVGYNNQQFYIQFYFDNASYVLDRATVEAPTGLGVDGNKVTGLDSTKTYAAAPYTINGVDFTQFKDLDSDTELSGIWAIYHPETDNTLQSDYVLLYFLGTYADRSNVFAVDESGYNLYSTDATNSAFVPGTIVLPGGNVTNSGNLKIASYHYPGLADNINAEGITDEAKKALFEPNIEAYRTYRYAYAFTADEISPVSELVSYTWGLAQRYMPFNYTGLVSRFVAHIMDENGKITEYEYLHAAKDLTGGLSGSNYADRDLAAEEKFSKKVDFMNTTSEFGRWTTPLPEDGYLVAFEIFPLYGMDDYTKVTGTGTTGGVTSTNTQVNIHIYNDSADFVLVPDPKPSFINLVLDGQIGIKFTVEEVTADDVLEFANFSAGEYTAPEFVFDETTGSATAILYVAPKDAADLVVTGDIVLNGYPMLRDFEVSVPGYIEENKDNESEDFVAAKPLLEAIDTYCEYAGNYFDSTATALEPVVLDTTDREALAEPLTAKRIGSLDSIGLEFNSTSLILEETVTIRHYFKVVDANKFEGAGVPYLVPYSDTIYYIDVADIAAHELSTSQEVLVYGGDAEMTISFSVIDYVKLTWSNENDVKLANLAKALYKYSVEADAYEEATAE